MTKTLWSGSRNTLAGIREKLVSRRAVDTLLVCVDSQV